VRIEVGVSAHRLFHDLEQLARLRWGHGEVGVSLLRLDRDRAQRAAERPARAAAGHAHEAASAAVDEGRAALGTRLAAANAALEVERVADVCQEAEAEDHEVLMEEADVPLTLLVCLGARPSEDVERLE
jgi:hypothetical protein